MTCKSNFFVQILGKSQHQNIELFHAISNKIPTSEHFSLIEVKGLPKATFSCNFKKIPTSEHLSLIEVKGIAKATFLCKL